ncbi:hypothetical protein N7505_012007 [Penicillium chrysogenum]|uniref:Protein kinase domain-containing protein n=2 Tax=Penicillium chrysogenum TaxID=5076 RepID=A0ABQ8W091_PENCH|nr:hypothetical protein N7505_012007 [Penicillium chrysogenum]
MYDIIDESTIALEWLDTTLAELKYCPDIHYKPANILLSGIQTNPIIAKVADLGLGEQLSRSANLFQPYAMRAREVFLGKACTELSQVWAVAAMLLCWIKPGVLGAWDSPLLLLNDAWSMAKIQRLFAYWEISTPETDVLKVAVESARSLSEVPELQAILSLDEETKKAEMPQQLRDLLRFILVPDPKLRPSASSVLASSEFRKFENYVSE